MLDKGECSVMGSVTVTQKVLSTAAHAAYFFGGIGYLFVPLLIWRMNTGDPFVAHHAKQAFYIQLFSVGITLLIILAAFFVEAETAVFAGLASMMIFWVIFSVVGSVKALSGEYYSYPILALVGLKPPGSH